MNGLTPFFFYVGGKNSSTPVPTNDMLPNGCKYDYHADTSMHYDYKGS